MLKIKIGRLILNIPIIVKICPLMINLLIEIKITTVISCHGKVSGLKDVIQIFSLNAAIWIHQFMATLEERIS